MTTKTIASLAVNYHSYTSLLSAKVLIQKSTCYNDKNRGSNYQRDLWSVFLGDLKGYSAS
jgi:hypothetical protein